MVNKFIHLSKKRILIGVLFGSCLVVIPLLSFYARHFPLLDKERFLFIPPAEYLQSLRGSFKNFLADIYYIRGILALTDTFSTYQQKIYWIQEHCRAAVILDSRLLQAFFFGGIVVAKDKESTRRGIGFLEEGLRLLPTQWEIPYWLGFNHYTLGEYLEAAQFYQAASLLPGAPKFLRSNQPMLYYKAGKPELGPMYLEGLLETIKDPRQLEWIKLKIDWLKGILVLEGNIRDFYGRYQRYPKDLDELVDKGLITALPEDPFGQGYYFDPDAKRVKSNFGFLRPDVGRASGECSECAK
jgi:hypothetical protein